MLMWRMLHIAWVAAWLLMLVAVSYFSYHAALDSTEAGRWPDAVPDALALTLFFTLAITGARHLIRVFRCHSLRDWLQRGHTFLL